MTDSFVYEFMQISSLKKPILIKTIQKSKFEDERFDVKKYAQVTAEDLPLKKGVYITGPNITWAIYYAKTTPDEYYTISEGFLVDV